METYRKNRVYSRREEMISSSSFSTKHKISDLKRRKKIFNTARTNVLSTDFRASVRYRLRTNSVPSESGKRTKKKKALPVIVFAEELRHFKIKDICVSSNLYEDPFLRLLIFRFVILEWLTHYEIRIAHIQVALFLSQWHIVNGSETVT